MSAFVWSLPSFLPDSPLHACGKEKKFLVSLSHAATHAWGAQYSVESSFWKIWDKYVGVGWWSLEDVGPDFEALTIGQGL
jgi:hypothetical protein